MSLACRVSPPDEIAHDRGRARLEAALVSGEHAIVRRRSVFDGVLARRHGWMAGVAAAALALLISSIGLWVATRSRGDAPIVAHLGVLPVAALTPGATWAVTREELCAGARHTRAITGEMRREVVAAYHVGGTPEAQYELDYLVTPELGGATDARNLWPQAYTAPIWNARVKDELEQLLPRLVCAGQLDLETAQHDMAVDWIAAYKKYFRTDRPLQAHRGPSLDDDDTRGFVLADARPAPAVRPVKASFVH